MAISNLNSPRILYAVTSIGALGVAYAYFAVDRPRFWTNWVYWFVALFSIAIGSLFIVALQHLVSARWSIPIRRVPERLATLLIPILPIGLVALFAISILYPGAKPEAALNPLLANKAWWLGVPWFSFRTVIVLVLSLTALSIFVRGSLRQDKSLDATFNLTARRFAPGFMILFAFMITLIAFDWISGLTPEWYSDIFGVYLFAGSFLAALSATSLAVVNLQSNQRLNGVKRDHLYNLGGFIFAFTVFWSYIGFAQYMLMWYANLPEEVHWYHARLHGGWHAVTITLAIAHFVIPFFALSTRDAKSNPKRLVTIGIVMLGAHLLDVYWLIFPSIFTEPVFNWPELCFGMLFLGTGLIWLRKAFTWGEDMPIGDPFLREGLEFRL